MKLIEPLVQIWNQEIPWFIPFVEAMLPRLFSEKTLSTCPPISQFDLLEHRVLRLSDLALCRIPSDPSRDGCSSNYYETEEVCYLLDIEGNIIGEVGSFDPAKDAFAYSHREDVWGCAERLRLAGVNIDKVYFILHASAARRSITLLYVPRFNTWSQYVGVLLAEYQREVGRVTRNIPK